MKSIKYLSFLFVVIGLFSACGGNENSGSKKVGDNTVNIHELGDPDKLNPILSTSAGSTYIEGNIFQTLLGQDPITYEQTPSLAIARPKVTKITSGKYKGGMTLEYEIRPDAVWDNGTPITGYDYVFTLKAVKNPKVDALSIRPYLEFIKDVIVDKNNPKKFTVYSADTYILSESSSAYWVYPEYHYDAKKIMRKFTFQQLNDPKSVERLRSNRDIIAFATEFNSEKYQREAGYIVGSGPYKFKEWVTGQYIVLEKKKDWWGNKHADLTNGPDKITYTIVTDWTTTIAAMKDEGMDIARGIRSKDFMDLKDKEIFTKNFTLHTPDYMAYDYIGMNMKSKIFKDKKTREAMAHLVDKAEILDILMYGLGVSTEGPFHPTKKYYNKNLKPRPYSLKKAEQLLASTGWKDTDQDGVLDKVIDGVKTPFKVTIKYNQGNDRRKNTALMLSENAKKIGVEVEVLVREWTIFIEETKKHKFDMYIGGWVGSTGLEDPKQIWHSSSYNGGSNYVGFGNATTDRLIEKIRYEIDENKRNAMYLEFQQHLYDDVPYVFLNAQKNKLAFHKRFNNAKAYVSRPGYAETEWSLNPIWGAASKMDKN